jgi:anti-sigma28 factor (negative regulator of flagellin synthesis)
MALSEIPGGPKSVNPLKEERARESTRARRSTPESGDRVSLSTEARSMYQASLDARLDEIREKVRAGFYDRPGITEQVVEEILKDLQRGG